jgi:hypothetical protein
VTLQVPTVPKKRQIKSAKRAHGPGKGNKSHKDPLRRIRTQVLEGSSQSDVTVEDVGSLSRDPNHSKTVHVVGHCQKLCQERGKLTGTTPVVYFASTFDRALKLRGWGTLNKPLPTNWSDREKTYSELSASLGQEAIFQMDVN